MKNFPTKTLTSRRDKKKPRAINLGQHPGPRGQARGQRGVSTSKGGKCKTGFLAIRLESVSGSRSQHSQSRISVPRSEVFMSPTYRGLEEHSTQAPGPALCLCGSCKVPFQLTQAQLKRLQISREDGTNYRGLVRTRKEAGCMVGGSVAAHLYPVLLR